jgi:hypothetical protein
LETDLDDVERCDDESGDSVVRRVGVIKVVSGPLPRHQSSYRASCDDLES